MTSQDVIPVNPQSPNMDERFNKSILQSFSTKIETLENKNKLLEDALERSAKIILAHKRSTADEVKTMTAEISDLRNRLLETSTELKFAKKQKEELTAYAKSKKMDLEKSQKDLMRAQDDLLKYRELYITIKIGCSEILNQHLEEMNDLLSDKAQLMLHVSNEKRYKPMKEDFATTLQYMALKAEKNRVVQQVEYMCSKSVTQEMCIENMQAQMAQMATQLLGFKRTGVKSKDMREFRVLMRSPKPDRADTPFKIWQLENRRIAAAEAGDQGGGCGEHTTTSTGGGEHGTTSTGVVFGDDRRSIGHCNEFKFDFRPNTSHSAPELEQVRDARPAGVPKLDLASVKEEETDYESAVSSSREAGDVEASHCQRCDRVVVRKSNSS